MFVYQRVHQAKVILPSLRGVVHAPLLTSSMLDAQGPTGLIKLYEKYEIYISYIYNIKNILYIIYNI